MFLLLAFGRRIFSNKADITEEEIYGLNCVTRSSKFYCAPMPAAMCLMEVRVCVSGSEIVFGGPASGMDENQINKMTPTEFVAHFKHKDRFCALLKPGDMLSIPSGCLISSFVLAETLQIRWGVSPNFDGEEDRVKSMLASILQAKPSLRQTKYSDWYDTF